MHHARSIHIQATPVGNPSGHNPRQGSILVAALVCLSIVTLILLSVFKTSMSQRHQIRLEQQQVQAELLAESGLERAVGKLNSNINYAGEDWMIDAKQLDTRHTGLVKITVVKQDNEHNVTVKALFPAESIRQNQSIRTLSLPAPDKSDSDTTKSPDASKSPDAAKTTDAKDKAEVPE